MNKLRITLFLVLLTVQAFAAPTEIIPVLVNSEQEDYTLTPYIQFINDSTGKLTFQTVSAPAFSDKFKPVSKESINKEMPVQWIRFTVQNQTAIFQEYKISITFTDYIDLYTPDFNDIYHLQKSGDLVPLKDREVKVGQMVFFAIHLPPRSNQTYYARLQSSTGISQQFKQIALNSIKMFSQHSFETKFGTTHKMYQALFYGAIIIMLLYNFFIFCTLKDQTYLFYVLYTCFVVVFFASTNGYVFELLLPNHSRLDLYIRFLTTPALLFFYLLFSKSYLKPQQYAPVLNRVINGILCVLLIIALIMIAGFWHLGRSISIIVAISSFLIIIVLAIVSIRRGYTPARYFLAANILLLGGGIVYALQRISVVVQSPLSQYSIQIASIFEVALFSFGLAARISLTEKELTNKKLENERLERQKEIEIKNLIEEKNRELESKVIERTTEVMQQKEEIVTQNEEISAQNESLTLNNNKLEDAQKTIQSQYKKLSLVNVRLERKVRERTKELNDANEELVKSNQELDHFIYRTAHDIRGPLARLIGLSNLGLMEINDEQALAYLKKLNFEANYLSYLLARLSTIHEINHAVIQTEPIHFEQMLQAILQKVNQMDGFEQIRFEISVEATIEFNSDYKVIHFILSNLIDNAIQFRKKDKPDSFIAIQIKIVHHALRIQVIDNGIGISNEEAPKIFDMFSTAAGKHKTAGMGLYMSRLSAEKLRGKLTFIQNKSGYTEFQVQLPLQSHPVPLISK